jgi:hypothetical protein
VRFEIHATGNKGRPWTRWFAWRPVLCGVIRKKIWLERVSYRRGINVRGDKFVEYKAGW